MIAAHAGIDCAVGAVRGRIRPQRVPVPIGVAELPLDGTPEWPAASHCVVGNKLRLPQSLGKGRSDISRLANKIETEQIVIKCP